MRQTEHGWVCQICHSPCDPKLYGVNRADAPQCDHRVALVHGGPHTEANLQCVHKRCNDQKARAEGGSKLTAEAVKAIRAAYASGQVTYKVLGKRFGVAEEHVGKIVRGTYWQ